MSSSPSSSSSSSAPGQPTGGSNLAKAIRIALSFVNYSKPFDDLPSTSNDNNLSSTSLNPKCPGGGNFCSITSGSKSSSSSSSSSSSAGSSVGVVRGRAASSISVSGRQAGGGGGGGGISRSTGSELASELISTLNPPGTSTPLPPMKSVNFVHSRLADYYSDYDPMMGIRIAISLLGIIVMFAIFVVYKSHCNAKKARRLLPYRGSNRSVSDYRTP